MATMIGRDARSIIGVDYAATWKGINELISDMERPQVGPSSGNVIKASVDRFKESVRNPILGEKCRRRADEIRDSIPELKKTDRRSTRVWADDDGELDITRFLNDEEKYWRRTKRPKRPNRTIRLMAEISATGWSSDAELQTRCSTIVVMASWLMDAGYEVEVLAADYSVDFCQMGETELGTVIVKQASEDLDVDNLAGILCSQDFGFNILLRGIVHVCPKPVLYSWGYVQPIPAEVLRSLEVDVSARRDIMSEAKAADWLKSEVKRLSIPQEA